MEDSVSAGFHCSPVAELSVPVLGIMRMTGAEALMLSGVGDIPAIHEDI